ncbi:MAG TPA: B12-binding domain-containing protein [Anaerolineales bacterium]|nr:B12-binding domain-containing protein [Anaerolineales bacterium]
MISTTPAFNLKVVLKETGLAADTLRAWERRYGLPMPQRSAGGHRLYSQRDIETIKWLMKRQEEGLSISRAVDMWNEQIGSGTDPLADSISSTPAFVSGVPMPYQSPDATLVSLRAGWIEACMNFSESTSEQVLNQAFSMFPVESVCVEVLQKGMTEIGDMWYQNRASVQQEHFASALAIRKLDALLNASPVPTRDQTVLVGCPAEEWHTFTPLLLSLLLRRRGLNVLYLGANVPVSQLSETVKNSRVNLVVLIAQLLTSAATLQQTTIALSWQNIPVAFGGRIFSVRPELADYIPGLFLGRDLIAALDEIEVILSSRARQRQVKAALPDHAEALQAFLLKRPQIEMDVKESLEKFPILPEDVQTGVHFLGQNITAALQLGDMSHVSAEVDWLKGLLQTHGSTDGQLIGFMQTYAQAVDQNMNGKGDPVTRWIASEVDKLKEGS